MYNRIYVVLCVGEDDDDDDFTFFMMVMLVDCVCEKVVLSVIRSIPNCQ